MATRKRASKVAHLAANDVDVAGAPNDERPRVLGDDEDLHTLAEAHRVSRPSFTRGPRDRGGR